MELAPVEIKPVGDRAMGIVWEDGSEGVVTFTALRLACPCATCEDMRKEAVKSKPIDDRFQLRLTPPGAPSADPILVRADWVGNYAVRLVWEDGHDTGIYKFDLLRELCLKKG
ncbi:MAG: DUF971 domain-containing protein [Candidatus Omnitrophica bacterium]|nr:DUF971 domain-containing protein [Candidatus Omnitrophota bacterium]